MPTDKWNFPFKYATKPGGFFYEMEDNPSNSNFVDWPAEVSFNGNGTFIMEPNGPTDFGVGRYASSFNDSIGGCNMSFADTVARGYAYKADDVRDFEFKFVCQFEGIQSGNDLSISGRTGHHTGSGCCQGFAYMFGTDPNTNPTSFRFRKEMWHVSYHESPEGSWTHPSFNFKINGGRKVGLGFVIYNKPGSNNTRVVLEGWGNPDPVANPTNWIMLKRIEDFNGNGWGDDGDDCDGEPDQFGPWSGAQNRVKTNSTSGSITFEKMSFREIDPSRALDDTGPPPPPPPGTPPPPPGAPPPPPPGSGGGGTQASTISPVINYVMVSTNIDFLSQTASGNPVKGSTTSGSLVNLSPLQSVIRPMAINIAAAMVDPDPHARFGPAGWKRDTTTGFDIYSAPCNQNPTDNKIYADGLCVATYWSNSSNLCVSPGLASGSTGTDSNDVINHGGRIMKNPHIHLIFWNSRFTDWDTRTETPTKDQIIAEIRDKLLGSDRVYFNDIQQYGAPGYPGWGSDGTSPGGAPPPPPQTNAKMSVILGLANSHTKGSLTARQTCNANWGEEMIEGMTDPFMEGWHAESTDPNDPHREIGDDPCDVSKGADMDTYSDGLGLDSYWSNSDHDCIIPGKTTTSPPGVSSFPNMTYHGGHVMKNPKIWLIFWGADWLTRSATPTKAQLISDIQTKLLGTDTQYFSKLSQYGAPGIPVWGGAVQNNNIALSSDTTEVINKAATVEAATEDAAAAISVVKNTLNTGLIPIAGIDFDNTQFLVIPEFGRTSLWYGSLRTYTNILINNLQPTATTTAPSIETGGPEGFPGLPGGMSARNIIIDTPSIVDTFTPTLAYCAISLITSKATAASVTNLQWTDMMLSEELIEAQTDPEGTGWYGDTLENPLEEPIREIGDNPCDLDTGSFKGTYASGLSVMAYWSNSHANCIIPGITATDIGDSTAISFHGGRIIKNPVLRLIFWGTEWTTQTSPSKAEIITEVQTKLLVTNATFFSQLNQYSGCGTPVYGSAVQNNNIPYPTAGDHSSDRAAIEAVIKDSLNTALLPVTDSATMQYELYIVFLAKNKTITTDTGYSVDGYHSTLEAIFPS